MNYLKLPLTHEQIALLERELERLFVLQDKPFPESKKTIFVQEIRDTFYPFGAIVAGIRALAKDDLKVIKLHTITNEAKKFITTEVKRTDCKFCRGGGLISMLRDDGLRFTFSCICEAGNEYKGIARWLGKTEQDWEGRHFELYEYVLLKDKYNNWIELSRTAA